MRVGFVFLYIFIEHADLKRSQTSFPICTGKFLCSLLRASTFLPLFVKRVPWEVLGKPFGVWQPKSLHLPGSMKGLFKLLSFATMVLSRSLQAPRAGDSHLRSWVGSAFPCWTCQLLRGHCLCMAPLLVFGWKDGERARDSEKAINLKWTERDGGNLSKTTLVTQTEVCTFEQPQFVSCLCVFEAG